MVLRIVSLNFGDFQHNFDLGTDTCICNFPFLEIDEYELPPDVHEVAFSPRHQKAFDDHGVSWAVQWEVRCPIVVPITC
jgi:hypothetical protein